MQNQVLFELYDGAFWLSIIISLFGIMVIAGIIWFGNSIFLKKEIHTFKFLEKFIREILAIPYSSVTSTHLKAIADNLADFREKRNEFWSVYGQIVLAVFIVIILAILLITKTISAEAGLPILSAISGFAIAKSINSSRGYTPPIDPEHKE